MTTTPAQDLTALADKLDELAMKATALPWSFAPAVPGAKRCFYIAGNNAAHNRQVDIGTLQGGYFSCEANAAILDSLVNNLPTLTTALREAARLREALEKIQTVADNERMDATDTHYAVMMAGIQATARAALESPHG